MLINGISMWQCVKSLKVNRDMKMIKKIYSQEVVMQKYPLKANRFMAIVMTAALLPLAAIAAPGDEASAQNSAQPTSRLTASVSNEQTSNEPEIQITNTNGPIESTNAGDLEAAMTPVLSTSLESEASGSNMVPANSDNNPSTNASNDSLATKPSNADSVTRPLDNINELQKTSEAKAGVVVENQSATPTKKAPWYNLSYLLGGGLLLLILGGALLLFLKINKLQDEIEELKGERQSLKAGLSKSTNDIKQLKMAKSELELKLSQQPTAHNQSHSNNGVDDGLLPLEDAQVAVLVVEDLNAADRQQLTTSIDKWFATNRGQTQLNDLVPADIQKKLNHWRYAIELWGQGDGVDSVELVDSTKYGAVVSLTKPDKQGFAFCHKKPNSLSSVWVNKAWYEVQRTSSTLEVVGEPLEKN